MKKYKHHLQRKTSSSFLLELYYTEIQKLDLYETLELKMLVLILFQSQDSSFNFTPSSTDYIPEYEIAKKM